MIPILFENNETKFTSNGLGRLADCTRCIVTEERNGIFECEFDYPVNGVLFDQINEGRIIACTHDEQGDIQPFDIYKRSEPINGLVTFNAHHISYRLSEIAVKPFTAGSCAAALQGLKSNSINNNPFTFWTDKSVTANFAVDAIANIRNKLVGEEGSILDVYGTAEYEFDKFDVKLHLHRGQDTNASIRYGKNLIDYTNDLSYEDAYNAVAPYWLSEVFDDNSDASRTVLVLLPELYLDSGRALPSGRIAIRPLDLTDVFEDPPTVEQLRAAATSRMTSGEGWLPNQTVTIDFVQLWDNPEYADYAPLQRLRLCDTCGVFVPMYNVSLRAKVVGVTYNTLLDRYDSMTLGDNPTTFTAAIEKQFDSKVAGFTAGFKSIGVDIAAAQSASEKYTDAAKEEAAQYTDEAKAEANKYTNEQISSLKSNLETQIDAKIETWAQQTNPAANWTTTTVRAQHDGDLWLYTGTSNLTVGSVTVRPQGVYQYKASSNSWAAYSSTASNLFDLVDGKTTIYYGTTAGSYPDKEVGDYLVDSTDGSTYRWTGSAWLKVTDYQTYTNDEITKAKTSIKSEYEQAIDDATEQIRGGTGGYIVTSLNANGQPIELLITDNLDINKAVNVWRWNQGGLGHSSNGYNGPFSDVAITQDGKINASMILTGSLTANLIKAGILQDANQNVIFNLENGTIEIKKGLINLGNGKFIATDEGKLTAIGGGLIRDPNNNVIINLDTGEVTIKKGSITLGESAFSVTDSGRLTALTGLIGLFELAATYFRYKSDNANQQLIIDKEGFKQSTKSTVLTNSGTVDTTITTSIVGGGIEFGGTGKSSTLPTPNGSLPTSRFSLYPLYDPDDGWSAYIQGPTAARIAFNFKDNGTFPIYLNGKTHVTGAFSTGGTKSRTVDTTNYSQRLLYCYETPTPLFGDIGEAVLDEEGVCYVDIDDILTETIAEQVEYQVFLQKEGEGDCWIADKTPRFFMIKGTPGLKVAWELKAKQRDYELLRLDQHNNSLEEYEDITDKHETIDAFVKEMEDLLYG